jgi:hypothetical protein
VASSPRRRRTVARAPNRGVGHGRRPTTWPQGSPEDLSALYPLSWFIFVPTWHYKLSPSTQPRQVLAPQHPPYSSEGFLVPRFPNPSQFGSARSEGQGEHNIRTLTEFRHDSCPVHGELHPRHPGTPASDSQILRLVIPVGGSCTRLSMRHEVLRAIPKPPTTL